MTGYLQPLLDWVAQNPVWAGFVVFLVALSESLAIVGLVIPGVVIMFGVGALIATDNLAFWPTVGWAVAGAVAGDGLSFFLGRHFRDSLTTVWPFSRYPDMLGGGMRFFGKYGGKSVVFGRFVGPVRAVIPLVAGMMHMPPRNFLIANVFSALLWAPAYLLPGMVFGASLELAAEVAVRLVVMMLLLAGLIWFVVWIVRITLRLLHPHSRNLLQRLLLWSRLHPRLGDIAAALADPEHPEAKGLAILASLLLLSTLVSALILGVVIQGGPLHALNQSTLQLFQSLRTPWADHLMVAFTQLADTGFSVALVIAVLVYLVWTGHKKAALHWLAAALFAFLAPLALKYGLKIPRPDSGVSGLGPYAFPSAHVMRATVLYGFLSVLLARPVRQRWRWLPYTLASLIILMVGLSRLYLGIHWLPDVLGSISLGVLWVAALAIGYRTHSRRSVRWQGLAVASGVFLLFGVLMQTSMRHEVEVQRYSPSRSVTPISEADWWSGGWSRLPAYREDIAGSLQHPLNVQYGGDLERLRGELAVRGWQPAALLDWKNALRLLAPAPTLNDLPVLPQVHDAGHESQVLTRDLPDQKRLVLRLWAGQRVLEPGGEALWVGNVSIQALADLFDLVSYPRTSNRFQQALELLQTDAANLEHRRVELPAANQAVRRSVLLLRADPVR